MNLGWTLETAVDEVIMHQDTLKALAGFIKDKNSSVQSQVIAIFSKAFENKLNVNYIIAELEMVKTEQELYIAEMAIKLLAGIYFTGDRVSEFKAMLKSSDKHVVYGACSLLKDIEYNKEGDISNYLSELLSNLNHRYEFVRDFVFDALIHFAERDRRSVDQISDLIRKDGIDQKDPHIEKFIRNLVNLRL
jgi:hypothetical protein